MIGKTHTFEKASIREHINPECYNDNKKKFVTQISLHRLFLRLRILRLREKRQIFFYLSLQHSGFIYSLSQIDAFDDEGSFVWGLSLFSYFHIILLDNRTRCRYCVCCSVCKIQVRQKLQSMNLQLTTFNLKSIVWLHMYNCTHKI